MLSPLSVYPQRLAPPLAPPVVRFGHVAAPPTITPDEIVAVEQPDKYIEDDVYDLFRGMPKNELHLHQSGSADIAFLKFHLLRGIQKGVLKQMEIVGDDGQPKVVDVTGITSDNLWKLVTLPNVRRYFRAYISHERQKYFAPTETLDEQKDAPKLTDAELDRLYKEGLARYRATSAKINPVVKNLPAAYMLAHQYARDCMDENIRYAEYRVSFSNQGANNPYKDITLRDLVEAVEDGFEDANLRMRRSRKKLDYGVIILFERQGDNKVQRAVDLARQVVELRKAGKPVVGVDLAGDELNNPVTEFAEAFQIIKDYNETAPAYARIGITIHAGETRKSGDMTGWQSVQEAIRIGHDENTPMRVGHGLQVLYSSRALLKAFAEFKKDPHGWQKKVDAQQVLAESPLIREIIEKGVALEMCPKSNVQTLGVNWYTNHPAIFLSQLGVKVNISTDNRTISNSDVTNEFVKLYKYQHATYDDLKRMVLDGFDTAFIHDADKKLRLKAAADRRFLQLEMDPRLAVAIYKTRHQGEPPNFMTFLGITLKAAVMRFFHDLRRFWGEWKWQLPQNTPVKTA